MLRHAVLEHPAGGHLEGSEERRRPMPLAIMGHRPGPPALERQSRLGAVERLDLTLLVKGKDHRSLRRMEIEPGDVAQVGDEGPEPIEHLDRNFVGEGT